ncbi:Tetratricopeptide repeat family protein [Lachnospiraceae bacterium TWA4]|nr:Tetratricopeptide repeat family protein [Lachnospiraceae bacterium TWA4]
MIKKVVLIGSLFLSLTINLTACGKSVASYTKEGIKAYESASYQNAIEYFKAAMEEDSTKIENYVYSGMTYLALDDVETAKTIFKNGMVLDSSSIALKRGLALCSYLKKDYEDALTKFKEVNDLTNDDELEIESLIYEARCLIALKNYKDAIDVYNELIELDNTNPTFYYERGCLFLRQESEDEAIKDFTNASKLSVDDIEMCWKIYSQYHMVGNDKQSDIYLDKALAISLNDDKTKRYKARFYYEKGEYKQAIALYDILSNQTIEDKVYKARAYQKANQVKEANTIFREIIRDYPMDDEGYRQYALYLLEEKKTKQAIKWLESGLEQCKTSEALSYQLIIAYEQLGDFKKAREALLAYESKYGKSAKLEKERKFLEERM